MLIEVDRGEITIGGASNAYANIIGATTATSMGNTTVHFDHTSTAVQLYFSGTSGEAITIASTFTIDGGGGTIYANSGVILTNQGSILADYALGGRSLILSQNSGGQWINEGTITASLGNSISASPSSSSFTNAGVGSMNITGGGTLTLGATNGTFSNAGTITANTSTLTFQGTWDNTGTVTATDSTVILGGSFTTADLTGFTLSGSSVLPNRLHG